MPAVVAGKITAAQPVSLADLRLRDIAFQDAPLTARGVPPDTLRIAVTIAVGKQLTVIPYALGKTIIEAKDVIHNAVSGQLRWYLATGEPIELIVGRNTKAISKTLLELVTSLAEQLKLQSGNRLL